MSGTQDPGEGGGKTTGKGQAFLGEGRPEPVRSTETGKLFPQEQGGWGEGR